MIKIEATKTPAIDVLDRESLVGFIKQMNVSQKQGEPLLRLTLPCGEVFQFYSLEQIGNRSIKCHCREAHEAIRFRGYAGLADGGKHSWRYLASMGQRGFRLVSPK